MKEFGKQLVEWFAKNKRDLPWRETSDAYAIWLSEIILQQTRVNQGLPYYLRFINAYPTVKHLAAGTPDAIFKLWQGLGYYRRAENMMKAAQKIVTDFNGEFPKSFYKLKELPGVGDYTAAAVASIAYGEKVAVVDGNVYRFMSRLFGIKTEILSSQAKKEFSELMLTLMQNFHPGVFNQAVMEFGALYCVPTNPHCDGCIFNKQCFAFTHHCVQELPVVKVKKKKQKRVIYYLVLEWNGHVLVNHRTKNDIWKGLYDFPALEYNSVQNMETVLNDIFQKKYILREAVKTMAPFSKIYKHPLTHIDITARFIRIKLNREPVVEENKSLRTVSYSVLSELAVPRLVDRYLEDWGLGIGD